VTDLQRLLDRIDQTFDDLYHLGQIVLLRKA
jgi:hypothetical protein